MPTDDTSTGDGSPRTAIGQRLYRRIFVSSSNVDLHAHRAAVVRVLREMGQEVIDMKDFGAQDGDATTVSLDELAEADVVVFVVAWRYGALPDGETHSVTHPEAPSTASATRRKLRWWPFGR